MKEASHKIALIRLGVQASEFYEKILRQQCEKIQGHAPSTVEVIEADFDTINRHLPDNFIALKPLLLNMLSSFDLQEFSAVLIPNITLHTMIDRLNIEDALMNKLIHPIKAGIGLLNEHEINRITLFGTRHTMQTDQLARYFRESGITVDSPSPQHIRQIDDIRLQVYDSGYKEDLSEELHSVATLYEKPVLACTELSLLNTDERLTDLSRIHLLEACRHQ